MGKDAEKIIKTDEKYHSKECLKTIKLIDNEIKEVIDPVLKSKQAQDAVVKHLLIKRKSLTTFKEVSD